MTKVFLLINLIVCFSDDITSEFLSPSEKAGLLDLQAGLELLKKVLRNRGLLRNTEVGQLYCRVISLSP